MAELENTAVQLQIESAKSGSEKSNDSKALLNELYKGVSSSETSARSKVDSEANNGGSAAQPVNPEAGPAAPDLLAEKAYAALKPQPAVHDARCRGTEGSLDLVRPIPASGHSSVSQSAPETQTASASATALPGRASVSVQGAAEAGGAPEASGRFVRAATLANELGAQRMNVVMQDDQLGRISLRMVDRAGLIQAVVRTDGARAAHMISESLPVLLESLSQRGLSASWTSSQGQGYDQQSDPRQGQPRRQRQTGGQGSATGGRRAARDGEAVFRVEVR
jgi:hypothetical protein